MMNAARVLQLLALLCMSLACQASSKLFSGSSPNPTSSLPSRLREYYETHRMNSRAVIYEYEGVLRNAATGEVVCGVGGVEHRTPIRTTEVASDSGTDPARSSDTVQGGGGPIARLVGSLRILRRHRRRRRRRTSSAPFLPSNFLPLSSVPNAIDYNLLDESTNSNCTLDISSHRSRKLFYYKALPSAPPAPILSVVEGSSSPSSWFSRLRRPSTTPSSSYFGGYADPRSPLRLLHSYKHRPSSCARVLSPSPESSTSYDSLVTSISRRPSSCPESYPSDTHLLAESISSPGNVVLGRCVYGGEPAVGYTVLARQVLKTRLRRHRFLPLPFLNSTSSDASYLRPSFTCKYPLVTLPPLPPFSPVRPSLRTPPWWSSLRGTWLRLRGTQPLISFGQSPDSSALSLVREAYVPGINRRRRFRFRFRGAKRVEYRRTGECPSWYKAGGVCSLELVGRRVATLDKCAKGRVSLHRDKGLILKEEG